MPGRCPPRLWRRWKISGNQAAVRSTMAGRAPVIALGQGGLLRQRFAAHGQRAGHRHGLLYWPADQHGPRRALVFLRRGTSLKRLACLKSSSAGPPNSALSDSRQPAERSCWSRLLGPALLKDQGKQPHLPCLSPWP